MPYRTLGELRSELLARLGMGGMGASGGSNQVSMDSYLRNGQHQLYWTQEWRRLTAYAEVTTGIGQNQYDYPDGCARDQRILRIETTISGQYLKLREGISTSEWSNMDTQGDPQRFERFEQILVYPKSNSAYTLRIWYIRDLGRFTEDGDRATLDDEMILLHALANAKAHYRQPDAAGYQSQLNSLLGSLRGQSFGSDGVYSRDDVPMSERRPLVVGRDV